jgi:hypothetical protein
MHYFIVLLMMVSINYSVLAEDINYYEPSIEGEGNAGNKPSGILTPFVQQEFKRWSIVNSCDLPINDDKQYSYILDVFSEDSVYQSHYFIFDILYSKFPINFGESYREDFEIISNTYSAGNRVFKQANPIENLPSSGAGGFKTVSSLNIVLLTILVLTLLLLRIIYKKLRPAVPVDFTPTPNPNFAHQMTDKPPQMLHLQESWLILDHSAIGKDHIKHNMPCQDSRHIERIGQNWGVAVCCDGAGSATNSDIGSQFVAKKAAKVFAYAIEKHQWHLNDKLPSENEWQELSVQVLFKVYNDLELYAQELDLDIKSLACTVIVVIFSPIGLLVTHIGDGRAAYCNGEGNWKAMITPFKGEEANQTTFITSSIWHDTDKYIESRVFIDPPFAFTLLTDGCEDFAFLTYVNTAEIPDEIKIQDVNQPFDGFYQPLTQHFKELNGKVSIYAMQAEWAAILERGTDKIKDEPDDKTMILAIRV